MKVQEALQLVLVHDLRKHVSEEVRPSGRYAIVYIDVAVAYQYDTLQNNLLACLTNMIYLLLGSWGKFFTKQGGI